MKVLPIICICAILLSAVCTGCQNNQKNTEPKSEEEEKDTNTIYGNEFFGVPLKGKSLSSILKEMDDKVDVLSFNSEINDTADYYVVEFCGVPCGMTYKWKKQGDTYYIVYMNFLTSQQTEESIKAFVDGISAYYGEVECENEGDDILYARYLWNGPWMRPIHSEEGGLVIFF